LDSSTAAAIQLALLQQCHRQHVPSTMTGTGATIKHEPSEFLNILALFNLPKMTLILQKTFIQRK
jgi:TPP-dependent pyruvate/acetoin dehydrogenase alpha subunit